MLSYRSFFDVIPAHGASTIDNSIALVRSWLQSKRYDADLLEWGGIAQIAPNVEASLTENRTREGLRSALFTLREDTPNGPWTTQLVLTESGDERDDNWVWVDVRSPNQETAKVPRLVRDLLEVLDARDAGAELGPRPHIMEARDLPSLMEVLQAANRRGPVFIAGSHQDFPLVRWQDLIANLIRETAGLASAYVLDAEATHEFNRTVGNLHAVPAGTMRTFLRGADFGNALDARRHRLLTTQRLLDDAGLYRIKQILRHRAFDEIVDHPVPRQARRIEEILLKKADREFLRHNQTQAKHSATQASAPVTTVTALDSPTQERLPIPPESLSLTQHESASSDGRMEQSANSVQVRGADLMENRVILDEAVAIVLKSILEDLTGSPDISTQSIATMGSVVDELHVTKKALRRAIKARDTAAYEVLERDEELNEIRRRLEDEQNERAEVEENYGAITHENRVLRVRLQEVGHGESAWAPIDPDEELKQVDSFGTIFENWPTGKGLVWTGDPDASIFLDTNDPLGTWAKKTWQVLRALGDYVRVSTSGEFSGSVHRFLTNTPPDCFSFSAQRHAYDESEDVKSNPKYRIEREFPVPSHINENGKVFMAPHFKISQSGQISPRLHYYDATQKDGNVYVGYIGPHLRTKHTS